MVEKAILVLPYFGSFKGYFDLFLMSCSRLASFDLLIVTDDDSPRDWPPNVFVERMPFEAFKGRVQSKFDFEISLERPYKLCDFKPAYGYIFEDAIRGYDYWGACDCDLLFGDLDALASPLMAAGYDKIFSAGHLTLYRNDPENNRRFMRPCGEMGQIYRRALSEPDSKVFDESYLCANVHRIFESDGCRMFEGDLSYDVSQIWEPPSRIEYDPPSHRWREDNTLGELVFWADGRVLGICEESGRLATRDYTYVHLQRRKMFMDGGELGAPAIWVRGDRFESLEGLPGDLGEFRRMRSHSLQTIASVQQLKRFKFAMDSFSERHRIPFSKKKPYWLNNPYA